MGTMYMCCGPGTSAAVLSTGGKPDTESHKVLVCVGDPAVPLINCTGIRTKNNVLKHICVL